MHLACLRCSAWDGFISDFRELTPQPCQDSEDEKQESLLRRLVPVDERHRLVGGATEDT
jgi:hypothetical protein